MSDAAWKKLQEHGIQPFPGRVVGEDALADVAEQLFETIMQHALLSGANAIDIEPQLPSLPLLEATPDEVARRIQEIETQGPEVAVIFCAGHGGFFTREFMKLPHVVFGPLVQLINARAQIDRRDLLKARDGEFHYEMNGRDYHVKVYIHPIELGEKIKLFIGA